MASPAVATPSKNLQLFPPPPPRTQSNSNPFRKPGQHQQRKTPSPLPVVEAIKSSAGAQAVVVELSELPRAGSPAKQPTQTSTKTTQDFPPPPPPVRTSSVQKVISSGQRRVPIIKAPRPPALAHLRGKSEPSTVSRSPTSPHSPIAIRSIFPTYDPAVPLNKQQYFPQRAVTSADPPRQLVSRESYNARATTPSNLDEIVGGLKTAPASVVNFPANFTMPEEPEFSTTEELLRLWAATNGPGDEPILGSFKLQMARTDAAIFTFGPPTLPFYTLRTYSTDELSITRNHPTLENVQYPIMLLALENRARRLPPMDGLVSMIFPKLAAMLAMDQATKLTEQHQLAPTVAEDMMNDALHRAAAQESCRLFWNETHRRYELKHPAIAPNFGSYAMRNTTASPISPVQTHIPGVLYITVTSPSSVPHAPPTILVTTPLSSLVTSVLPASPRTSTQPLSDMDEPLASLDFGTMSLTLNPLLIQTTIPSLYGIDALMSAIFAVAVSDQVTNGFMGSMDLWTPESQHKATRPHPLCSNPVRSSAGSLSRAVSSQQMHPAFATSANLRGPASIAPSVATARSKTYTGDFFATLAEREEAEQETQLMAQISKKDIARSKTSQHQVYTNPPSKKKSKRRQFLHHPFSHTKSPLSNASTFDDKITSPTPSSSTTLKPSASTHTLLPVKMDIDVDSYTHYQSGSRKGQELPKTAQWLLSLMFFFLKIVVWCLTAGVKVAAGTIVVLARCGSSEKF